MATDLPRELRPEMGLWSTTMLIIGSMVGSGIFFVPAVMVVATGAAAPVLLAFLIGGVLSLAGALVLAELAAAYPRAGGQAVYLREAFGRIPAYLFTWASFTGVQSAAIAAIAIAFAQTVDGLWGLPGPDAAVAFGPLTLPPWGVSFLAVGLVWVLTTVNAIGVRRGAGLNNIATVAKLAGLAIVVGVAFLVGRSAGNYADTGADLGLGAAGLGGFGLAVAAGLFAYDGWAQPTFVASEVRDPQRNVPLALLIGVLSVMAVYLVVVAAYLHILPAGAITEATHVAEATVRNALAGTGTAAIAGIVVGLAILVSTLGATNAYVLTSPRIYYDEAREGAFPRPFGRLNRFRTPGHGLVYQGVWASLLALTGTFEQLAFLIVFVVYLFYVLVAVGHVRLRRRAPERFTRFRMPLWPVPLVVFIVVGAGVLLNLVVERPQTAVWAAALLAVGGAVYPLSRRAARSTPGVK